MLPAKQTAPIPVTHASTRPNNFSRERNVFDEDVKPQMYLETEINQEYEGQFNVIEPVQVKVPVRESIQSAQIFQENAQKMQRHATYLGKRSIDMSKKVNKT